MRHTDEVAAAGGPARAPVLAVRREPKLEPSKRVEPQPKEFRVRVRVTTVTDKDVTVKAMTKRKPRRGRKLRWRVTVTCVQECEPSVKVRAVGDAVSHVELRTPHLPTRTRFGILRTSNNISDAHPSTFNAGALVCDSRLFRCLDQSRGGIQLNVR